MSPGGDRRHHRLGNIRRCPRRSRGRLEGIRLVVTAACRSAGTCRRPSGRRPPPPQARAFGLGDVRGGEELVRGGGGRGGGRRLLRVLRPPGDRHGRTAPSGALSRRGQPLAPRPHRRRSGDTAVEFPACHLGGDGGRAGGCGEHRGDQAGIGHTGDRRGVHGGRGRGGDPPRGDQLRPRAGRRDR